MTSPNMSFLSMTGGVRKDAFAEICEHGDLIAFLSARLDEDERELVRVAEPLRRVLLSARMRRETAFKRAILGQYRTAVRAACSAMSRRSGRSSRSTGRRTAAATLIAAASVRPSRIQAWGTPTRGGSARRARRSCSSLPSTATTRITGRNGQSRRSARWPPPAALPAR